MKITQLFRDQLGLSQEMMAQYLVITKSQLAMYESGKRELPSVILTKLAEMSLFFEQNKTVEEEQNPILEKQELEVQTLLARCVKDLEYKQMKEQRWLDVLQKRQRQNLQLYSYALHLQKSKSQLADVFLQQAISRIQRNSLTHQTQQKLKLEGIQSQLDYIRLLNKNK